MTINHKLIQELENAHRRLFPANLKKYLMAKYSTEPFPHEYSKQDLFTNIKHDIEKYDAGSLYVTVKPLKKRMQEEIEHLQELYIDEKIENRRHSRHIAQLEGILRNHGLESPKMAEDRLNIYP